MSNSIALSNIDSEIVGLTTESNEIKLSSLDSEVVGLTTRDNEVKLSALESEVVGLITQPKEVRLGDLELEILGVTAGDNQITLFSNDLEVLGVNAAENEVQVFSHDIEVFGSIEQPPLSFILSSDNGNVRHSSPKFITLTRDGGNLSSELVVSLATNPNTIIAPATITLPANEISASFRVFGVGLGATSIVASIDISGTVTSSNSLGLSVLSLFTPSIVIC